MKHKLLESSLIVFGAALFVRLTIALAPHGFHLPRLLREDSNAVMVISLALALSIGGSLLLPRIKLPRISRAQLILAAIGVLGILATFVVIRLSFSSPPSPAPQVTWDK